MVDSCSSFYSIYLQVTPSTISMIPSFKYTLISLFLISLSPISRTFYSTGMKPGHKSPLISAKYWWGSQLKRLPLILTSNLGKRLSSSFIRSFSSFMFLKVTQPGILRSGLHYLFFIQAAPIYKNIPFPILEFIMVKFSLNVPKLTNKPLSDFPD